MSKNVDLLKGLFGSEVSNLTEEQTSAISGKLDKLIETRTEVKVKFQTEVLEAEAQEKYSALLTEATSKYDSQLQLVESKTIEAANAHKEKMEAQVKTLSSELTEKKEQEVATFKKFIVEKLDKYLELELEKKVPETYVEAVAQVSVLQPIVDGFKRTMEENYIKVDDENFGLLRDAKEEITSTREDHAKVVKENMDLNSQLKEIQRSLKISEVCEGLTDPQREKAAKLLESYDSNEIDDAYGAIRDLIIESVEVKDEEEVKVEEEIGAESEVPAEKGLTKEAEEDEVEDGKEEVEEADEKEEEEVVEESVETKEIQGWMEIFREQVEGPECLRK